MATETGSDPACEADGRRLERQLIALARRWRLDEAGTLADQAVLALMQHHGSPTRLLDVTSDPMTALWFATDGANGGSRGVSGALFAFDVTNVAVMHSASALNAPTYGSMADPLGWHFAHNLRESRVRQQPVLLDPTRRDDRMAAQQGHFLFGSFPSSPSVPGVEAFEFSPGVEAPGEGVLRDLLVGARGRGRPQRLPFVALVVPAGLKVRLRRHLETTYNRSREILFPDYAGLADGISGGALALPDVDDTDVE